MMACFEKFPSFVANNRSLQVKIVPKAGSQPTFVELGLRIIDRGTPPGPTVTKAFSATQLAAGIPVDLQPGKRYEMVLVAGPDGIELIVTITRSDGKQFVNGVTCKRDVYPIVGHWIITTRNPGE